MSSAPTAAEIAADATWLAQALDPAARLVRLVRMTAEGYRQASFFDDRILQRPVEQHIVPLDAATQAIGDRRDVQWIFHIGHVGSTLLSRLLGELGGTLAVREPRMLRDMALTPGAATDFADAARGLFSRTFAPGDRAVVKATSFVSEIAAPLIGDGRAIFVYAEPRAYLGTILAGENSLVELDTLDPVRRQRMAGRVDLPADDRQPFKAAAAWACEMTALEAAAAALSPDQVLWIDFDDLLADVPQVLGQCAAFLGIDAAPDQLAAIGTGPLMHRYSKALEYDYSPSLRTELIAEATQRHRADVQAALAMLGAAAQESPLLARALERS